MTRRRKIGERERARIFLAHNGCCHICGGKIDGLHKAWDVDHIIPLEMGGDDEGDNLAPAHRACHAQKTATEDVPQIRKAQRMERRKMGIRKQPTRSLPGSKASGWKKKLSGEWVRR
jgi:5-methylcytosine-specific restriction endonuclease McrA